MDSGTRSAEVIADAVLHMKSQWPSKGSLIIEVNPGQVWGKTWLPWDMVSHLAIMV